MATSGNESSYYHSHHEQFGWKMGSERCPRGVGEMNPGERSQKFCGGGGNRPRIFCRLTLLHCACRSISRAWKVRFSSWMSLWLLGTAAGLATPCAMAADYETKQRAETLALGPHGNGTFEKFEPLSFTCSLYQVSNS